MISFWTDDKFTHDFFVELMVDFGFLKGEALIKHARDGGMGTLVESFEHFLCDIFNCPDTRGLEKKLEEWGFPFLAYDEVIPLDFEEVEPYYKRYLERYEFLGQVLKEEGIWDNHQSFSPRPEAAEELWSNYRGNALRSSFSGLTTSVLVTSYLSGVSCLDSVSYVHFNKDSVIFKSADASFGQRLFIYGIIEQVLRIREISDKISQMSLDLKETYERKEASLLDEDAVSAYKRSVNKLSDFVYYLSSKIEAGKIIHDIRSRDNNFSPAMERYIEKERHKSIYERFKFVVDKTVELLRGIKANYEIGSTPVISRSLKDYREDELEPLFAGNTWAVEIFAKVDETGIREYLKKAVQQFKSQITQDCIPFKIIKSIDFAELVPTESERNKREQYKRLIRIDFSSLVSSLYMSRYVDVGGIDDVPYVLNAYLLREFLFKYGIAHSYVNMSRDVDMSQSEFYNENLRFFEFTYEVFFTKTISHYQKLDIKHLLKIGLAQEIDNLNKTRLKLKKFIAKINL